MTEDNAIDPDEFHSKTRPQNRPTVYLAGPIQHAHDGGHGWRDTVINEYPNLFDWVNPLDEFDGGEDTATILPEDAADDYEPVEGEELITDKQVVQTDKKLVQQADALLIGFHDKVPAWGTPFEQAIASGSVDHLHNGKPVAVWHANIPTEELSPWLRYHATFYSQRMVENVEYLEATLEATPLCVDCRKESGANLQGIKFEASERTCARCNRNNAVKRHAGVNW